MADGRLYYVGPKKEEKREVVIDPERKRQVFLECHFNDIGHHLGQKKTVHRIQSKYYWLGIVRDVVDWVCLGHYVHVQYIFFAMYKILILVFHDSSSGFIFKFCICSGSLKPACITTSL